MDSNVIKIAAAVGGTIITGVASLTIWKKKKNTNTEATVLASNPSMASDLIAGLAEVDPKLAIKKARKIKKVNAELGEKLLIKIATMKKD